MTYRIHEIKWSWKWHEGSGMSRRKTDAPSGTDADKGRKKVVSPTLDWPDGKVSIHPVAGNLDGTTRPFTAAAPEAGWATRWFCNPGPALWGSLVPQHRGVLLSLACTCYLEECTSIKPSSWTDRRGLACCEWTSTDRSTVQRIAHTFELYELS